ncbi:MAG: hypothetical protein RQ729_07595 [Wenzhouxiangellaceae bacterium]|nr:hypothetical protein [Wenzhouxiangellaceae bacterium]
MWYPRGIKLLLFLLFFGPPSFLFAKERIAFEFSGWTGPALTVYGVEPESVGPDTPVVFVMHGVLRNAAEYRDNWVDLAKQHSLRVYVPEFDRERFPGAAAYNLGNVGGEGPSAFAAIEPIFQYLRESRGVTTDGYVLFGHSAGAQFVHRFVCFAKPKQMLLAIVANAGWYTLPDRDELWPYGLDEIDPGACDIEQWLTLPLLILLGEEDTDPEHQYLRRTPAAMRQGPQRFARGHYFLQAGQAAAEARDVPLRWRIDTVPDVGHDNAGMAKAVAPRVRQWVGEFDLTTGQSRL